MELFRDNSEKDTLTVTLEQLDDGSIRLYYHDLGQSARELHGDSDYEAWLTVAQGEVSKLTMALLAERFTGNSKALSELQALCKSHEIEAEFGCF